MATLTGSTVRTAALWHVRGAVRKSAGLLRKPEPCRSWRAAEPSAGERCLSGDARPDQVRWPTDDAEAVARSLTGDLDAYEVLVVRYTAAAHRTALLLGAGDEAEDVVQEAFMMAFRKLRWFRGDGPLRPWLLRIVANETKNLHRSRRRRDAAALRAVTTTVDEAPATASDPEAVFLDSARRDELTRAVGQLAERDRLVITCRYFLDLSEAETAQVLGWPRGTVKSRLSRALGRLSAVLVERRGEEVAGG
jgi:RNA polymerase sigma factor (sigma-70 family)